MTISGPRPNANCIPAPVNDGESANKAVLRLISGGILVDLGLCAGLSMSAPYAEDMF
jgi:hypothetical protein